MEFKKQHATHLLNSVDKMYKYGMDPATNVDDIERTLFCPQTVRQTDGQGETSIPCLQQWCFLGNSYLIPGT